MICAINGLKYDTDNMELISEKIEYLYESNIAQLAGLRYRGKNVKLYKSKKGNWLLTYEKDSTTTYGKALTEEEAKSYLIRYDLEKYEELFGELEEA